jgi:hypothetical protein
VDRTETGSRGASNAEVEDQIDESTPRDICQFSNDRDRDQTATTIKARTFIARSADLPLARDISSAA